MTKKSVGVGWQNESVGEEGRRWRWDGARSSLYGGNTRTQDLAWSLLRYGPTRTSVTGGGARKGKRGPEGGNKRRQARASGDWTRHGPVNSTERGGPQGAGPQIDGGLRRRGLCV